MQGLIKVGLACDQVGVRLFKRGGLTVDIDKDGVEPDVAAHLDQPQQGFVDRVMYVVAGAAYMPGLNN